MGWIAYVKGIRSKFFVLPLIVATFGCTLYALELRGNERGACPLMDFGERFLFLAWSLSIFYLFVGSAYRISLLGIFSAPIISLFLGLSLLPGMMDQNPVKKEVINPWSEAHAATSVLSYGALGLATLSAIMFLVLDKILKKQGGGKLMKTLPPVSTLLSSTFNLVVFGTIILTAGVIAGFFSGIEDAGAHLLVATLVWLSYVFLIVYYLWKGMTPRLFSRLVITLFVASFAIFYLL